ncbi:MAG: ABC transporter ATP-binding protein [Opitutales bacterium]
MSETPADTPPPEPAASVAPASPLPPILRAEGLDRYLGEGDLRTQVLKEVTLELYPSNTYAIVGPSGSGKSTLLYLLGLLDRPDGGSIYLGSERLSHASDRQRTVARNRYLGFVFQFHFLLPEFTARENVMLPMFKHARVPKTEMRERAAYLLDLVGLGNKLDRPANRLSGGEQQRVAIARSLANEPRLLLADEPTGNLDVANSNRVFDLLYRLAHESGQAILMVTHDDSLAARCDINLHMRDGALLSSSPTGNGKA